MYLSLLIFFNNNCLIFHEKFSGHDFSNYLKEFKWVPEAQAYELLKENPINKNINFLSAPIGTLYDLYRTDKFSFDKLKGGFAITGYTFYERLIPMLKKIGINVLFATSAKNKKYEGITVLTFPYTAYNGIEPHSKKDIYYSFIGSLMHPVRKKIFSMKHPSNTVIKKRDKFHFIIQGKDLIDRNINNKLEYQNVLSRSRFSLCPRGTGAGSYRFWESLQAGAIPILISDEYQLPSGFDWKQCIVRVAQKDVEKIPQIISKISSNQEIEMRKNCLKAYSMFSGKNLVKVVRDYYNNHN